MKKISLPTVITGIFILFWSCGGRPGGFKNLEDIIPEFNSRLNEACVSGNFQELMRLFDKKARLMLDTEFHPEVHEGIEDIRNYFTGLPLDTKFSIGEIDIKGLIAHTNYTYEQKNGAIGKGRWDFKFNNMGKIIELVIIPGELSNVEGTEE